MYIRPEVKAHLTSGFFNAEKEIGKCRANIYRDMTMAQVSEDLVGKEIRLAGWVENIRDHGGVSFVDLRDMYGSNAGCYARYNVARWNY